MAAEEVVRRRLRRRMVTDSTTTREAGDESVPQLGSELVDLIVAYLKQETLQPLKGLGRFVTFGTAGSVVLGMGLVILDLAGLRALQEVEGRPGEVFFGPHSWMPYAIVALATVVVMALAGLRILRGRPR
jgi:hypothetical protein